MLYAAISLNGMYLPFGGVFQYVFKDDTKLLHFSDKFAITTLLTISTVFIIALN